MTIEFMNSGQNGKRSRVDSPSVILEPIEPSIIIEVNPNKADNICRFAKAG